MENQDHEAFVSQIKVWIEEDILNGDNDPLEWIEDLYRYVGGVFENDDE